MCADCHDLEDEDFAENHDDPLPEFCVECHDPHGSTEEYLLK